jgi:hypothetical protein
MQSNLRDNKTHVKDFDEGFPKRAEGRGLRYDLFFSRYFSAFASLFVFLEDETRIDAAKPEGV